MAGALDAARAEPAWRDSVAAGDPVPLNSVEGFVRQVMGWRDWIWHLYWQLGRDYRHGNARAASAEVPAWLWFHRVFVDGYDSVMVANVVRVSRHADGGVLATKPYAAGGAYIDRLRDYCGGCRYDPKKRLGADACPFTAGYWSVLERNRERLAGNQRMRQPLAGLGRLRDFDAVVEQEAPRGTEAS